MHESLHRLTVQQLMQPARRILRYLHLHVLYQVFIMDIILTDLFGHMGAVEHIDMDTETNL